MGVGRPPPSRVERRLPARPTPLLSTSPEHAPGNRHQTARWTGQLSPSRCGPAVMRIDACSRRPAGRQDLGLLQNRPRRRLLLVRRVAMLAQDALHQTA